MSTRALLAALRAAVGAAHVLTDPDVVAGQVRDWTGRFVGIDARRSCGPAPSTRSRPCCARAATPASRSCRRAATPDSSAGRCRCTARSCSTCAGSTRSARSTPRTGQVTAQAGVTIARLQAHARAAGWEYGVDLGARDSATVGGTIATNAGGVHVLRYGSTRRQLLGVEAVLADGRVMRRLDGLEKDNTGYDLVGSVVRERGHARGDHRGPAAAGAAARRTWSCRCSRSTTSTPRSTRSASCGAGSRRCERSSCSSRTVSTSCATGSASRGRSPARHAAFVLVEAAAGTDPTAALAAAIDGLTGVADVAVATDDRAARGLWRYREAPHRGDQPARRPAQARRHASGRRAGAVRVGGPRAGGGGRARSAGLAVRSRGRRQRSRERHRCRTRRRSSHRHGVAPRRASARIDQRRARDRHRETGVARARAFTCGDRRVPCDQDRVRPASVLNPHVLFPPIRDGSSTARQACARTRLNLTAP